MGAVRNEAGAVDCGSLPAAHRQPTMTLGMVPGTELANRFVAALRSGQLGEARRIALDEAPVFELTNFVVEPLIAKLGTLPRQFMAGQEASRKLARMLLKELVDRMFGGDVGAGGHRGADGRWYVFRGLSPDLVEVSSKVIEKVDKARFLDWLEPLEALLIRHLSGQLSRDEFVSAARSPDLVAAATYPHRALHSAATAEAPAATRPRHRAAWDPRKDPDLSVCFSGEHGFIILGGGQSHLVDQAYREALRSVRRMRQRDLLEIARRVLGEMLQPDYPNLIRNVTARVTPILGLSPESRFEIQEDMTAGGCENLVLMLALSRARHAGWLSDPVVEDVYSLRDDRRTAEGDSVVHGTDSYKEMVARLLDSPDDRGFLDTLDPAVARILVDDAIMLLQHQRARFVLATPADRMRRGLALLKVLSLRGVLDGFILHPFAGRNFFPAQFGRLAALNEELAGVEEGEDRQRFMADVASEEEVCSRAGLHADRIDANLVARRVSGLIAHPAVMAGRALNGALREIPDRPVAMLFHLREWVRNDPASPVWARDLDQSYCRLLAPWAAVLRPGDHVVLLEADSVFRAPLLAEGEFEELDLGLSPPDVGRSLHSTRPDPERISRRPLSKLEMPNYAVVLRKTAPPRPI
jgi:hypothetical protein